jgi:hypothetical protein
MAEIPFEHAGEKPPNIAEGNKSEFLLWLERNSSFLWTRFLGILGFMAVILEVVVHFIDIFKDGKAEEKNHIFLIVIFFVQALFILWVIFYLNDKSLNEHIDLELHIKRFKKYYKVLLNKELSEEQVEVAHNINDLNLNIFARYWLLFWKWIFLLYVLLALKTLLNVEHITPLYYLCMNVAGAFLNNFSMSFLFLCFLLIQSPLNSLNYKQENIESQFNRFLAHKSTLFTVTIGFSVAHLVALLAYYLKFAVWSKPELIGNDLINISNVNLVFSIISGVFNCFCLALLIARLDSKIINVPSSLISVLVVYAAIQPMYVFFDDKAYTLIVLIVSTCTLAFKIYFYLIIAYIINSGRLTDLFLTFPIIKKLIEDVGYKKSRKIPINPEDVALFNHHLELMLLILKTSGFGTRHYREKIVMLCSQVTETRQA